jgi:3',5'-cyclic AMP phosphodiesterase CpdA
MIATLIFSFIALATSEAVRRNRDSKERIDEELDTYQAIRSAFGTLRKDFSNVFFLNIFDFTPYAQFKAPPAGKDLTAYKMVKPVFIGSETSVHFATLTHFRVFADRHESEEAEVSYFSQADKKNTTVTHLFRRESSLIDEYPEEGGTSYVILEDLANVKFRYYNVAKDQWDNQWDSRKEPNQDEIPDAVEISMTVNQRNPLRDEIQKKLEVTEVFHPMFINSYTKLRMGNLDPIRDIMQKSKAVPIDPNNPANQTQQPQTDQTQQPVIP